MNDAAWKSLCFFESTLTPKIMTFVYWLMLPAGVGGGTRYRTAIGRVGRPAA